MAFARGHTWRISRAASRPFSSGIEKSRTATSGQRSRAARTAAWPASASAMTENPSRSSRALSPCRTITWSSASKILLGTVDLQGYGHDQAGSAAGRRDDLERSAHRVQPLLDSDEPEAACAPARAHNSDVEPHAVVADRAAELAPAARER